MKNCHFFIVMLLVCFLFATGVVAAKETSEMTCDELIQVISSHGGYDEQGLYYYQQKKCNGKYGNYGDSEAGSSNSNTGQSCSATGNGCFTEFVERGFKL